MPFGHVPQAPKSLVTKIKFIPLALVMFVSGCASLGRDLSPTHDSDICGTYIVEDCDRNYYSMESFFRFLGSWHGDEIGYLTISKGNGHSYKISLEINKKTISDEIQYMNIENEIVLSRMWYCVGFISGGCIDSIQVGLSNVDNGRLKIRVQDSFVRNLFFMHPKVIILKSSSYHQSRD